MSIVLKHYNGANVTPKDDAALYSHLEPRNGFIIGCEVSYLGGNQIQISGGYGIICGRLFLIEAETLNITLSSGTTLYGRLAVKLDLSNVSTPISFIQQRGSVLPDLTQENLVSGGTVFELPIATYNIEATQLSSFKDIRPIIYPENEIVKIVKSGIIDETLQNEYEYRFENVTSLFLTAGTGHCHGFIYFANSVPAIDVVCDGVLGDDINVAVANEKWEFDIDDKCAFFTNWGEYV